MLNTSDLVIKTKTYFAAEVFVSSLKLKIFLNN